jgi:hypothetical protein
MPCSRPQRFWKQNSDAGSGRPTGTGSGGGLGTLPPRPLRAWQRAVDRRQQRHRRPAGGVEGGVLRLPVREGRVEVVIDRDGAPIREPCEAGGPPVTQRTRRVVIRPRWRVGWLKKWWTACERCNYLVRSSPAQRALSRGSHAAVAEGRSVRPAETYGGGDDIGCSNPCAGYHRWLECPRSVPEARWRSRQAWRGGAWSRAPERCFSSFSGP